ncbi:unnamed protein product [Sphenostylis stenocarpa]|uniref:Subtilisin-like protease fibronectin type-III domain-containing protein n=1 Tax=Sphenostylis stenocarpa TaxID=92480 RepID=A0AA86VXM3_9FABA|nr:unnamed protein product [Sphenostylis stenocarpa]
MDPGLLYDLSMNDYLNFLCVSGYNQTLLKAFSGAHYRCPDIINIMDFNYPTMTIPKLYGSVSLTRRVKNVGSPGTYRASLRVSAGLSISVKPNVLKFDKIGEEKSYKLTVEVTSPGDDEAFGGITWSDGKHYVRSPIVVGGVRGVFHVLDKTQFIDLGKLHQQLNLEVRRKRRSKALSQIAFVGVLCQGGTVDCMK